MLEYVRKYSIQEISNVADLDKNKTSARSAQYRKNKPKNIFFIYCGISHSFPCTYKYDYALQISYMPFTLKIQRKFIKNFMTKDKKDIEFFSSLCYDIETDYCHLPERRLN